MDFCEYMFPYRNPFLFFHIFSKSIFRWTKNNRFRFGCGGSNRRIWYPIIGLFSSSGWVVLSLSDPCEGGAGILVSHSTVVGQSSMALAGNIIWAITTGKPENPQNVFFLWNPPNTLLKVFGTILICPEYSTVCWGYGFSSWLFWFWRWLICILCLNTFQLAAVIHIVKRVLVPYSAISTYVSMYGAVSASMRALQIRQALAFLYKIIPPSEWGSEPEWSLLSALPLHQGPPGCIGANWYCCCWWKKSC